MSTTDGSTSLLDRICGIGAREGQTEVQGGVGGVVEAVMGRRHEQRYRSLMGDDSNNEQVYHRVGDGVWCKLLTGGVYVLKEGG
jgi:hypothetical protein